MYCPHPESSQLPLYLIPLGCPRTLTLGALHHASNLHWSFNSIFFFLHGEEREMGEEKAREKILATGKL